MQPLAGQKRIGWGNYLKRNWELYLFVIPALIYLFAYCYYPMYGVLLAFKNYRIKEGIWGSPWVGLEHFERFFSAYNFGTLLWNTLSISIYSLIVGFLAVGMQVTVACPKGYRPAADVLMQAKRYGDAFKLVTDPDEAARDADVLFTDVWVSMGMERETERRQRDFTGYTLDAARMALAKPDCMVQHPLPAHRGEEIATDVFEQHADEIFEEAENRLHVEKAVLAILLAGK